VRAFPSEFGWQQEAVLKQKRTRVLLIFRTYGFQGSAKYSCEQIKQLVEGWVAISMHSPLKKKLVFMPGPANHLKQTFDILADISFFPKITPKDLEKERTVILEEIKMYHDLPQYYVGELLEELLWPDHPLGKALPVLQSQ